ncbi:MAG TPA: ligase-associated DNA damage response endonuclease PdeM [Caulobacteraceae bacterium]|jgi:hypothetical protein
MTAAHAIEPVAAPRLSRASCGGCAVALNGVRVVMRGSGGLWIRSAGAFVVGDLHLEKGSSYGVRGQMLPPYDTRATLERLEAEVEALAPQAVVLLGDTFHDRSAESRLAPDDAARLRALAGRTRLVWVVGNHDEDGPRALPGEVVDDVEVEGLRLVHEQARGLAPGEVSGHLHPVAKVVRYGAGVRRRCFLTDGRRMILPAFGAYAGGLNVLDRAFAGLFEQPPVAVALGDRCHALALDKLSSD